MQTGTINGSSSPVKPEIPILTYIANSIAITSMNGNDIDFSTTRIIRNTSPIDIQFTTLKSLSVSFIKSLVAGASPITVADLSYL